MAKMKQTPQPKQGVSSRAASPKQMARRQARQQAKRIAAKKAGKR